MSKKRVVVHVDNLPWSLPIRTAWLTTLSQSVWPAPGWVWGVAWTVIALLAVVVVIDMFNREARKVFPDSE